MLKVQLSVIITLILSQEAAAEEAERQEAAKRIQTFILPTPEELEEEGISPLLM